MLKKRTFFLAGQLVCCKYSAISSTYHDSEAVYSQKVAAGVKVCYLMYAAGNHSRGLRGCPRCNDEDVHSGTWKDVEWLSDDVFSSLPPWRIP
jgi:hypothetical protein